MDLMHKECELHLNWVFTVFYHILHLILFLEILLFSAPAFSIVPGFSTLPLFSFFWLGRGVSLSECIQDKRSNWAFLFNADQLELQKNWIFPLTRNWTSCLQFYVISRCSIKHVAHRVPMINPWATNETWPRSFSQVKLRYKRCPSHLSCHQVSFFNHRTLFFSITSSRFWNRRLRVTASKQWRIKSLYTTGRLTLIVNVHPKLLRTILFT